MNQNKIHIKNIIMEPEMVIIQEILSHSEDEYEKFQYFYHSDHLGSSSWIIVRQAHHNADASGTANQHLAYMPFGESFIDQRATGHDIRFKFTGKERDSETGFDYFGARYYSSGLSVWLSVDPLSDKYPSTSPFMYVGGHPIIITDPNGMDWIKDKDGNYKHDKNVTKDTKLGEGEIYLGKSKNISVTDSDGKEQYQIGLNEDGSMTDKMGIKHEKGFGEYDAGFKSGAKILSNKQDGNKRATVNSDINAAAIYGLGIMADYGSIEDSYDAKKDYFQIGFAIGYGGTVGTGKAITNKKVRANDIGGVTIGVSLSSIVTPASIEGFVDIEQGGVRDYYGDNVRGSGGNVGVGNAWFIYISYTFVFE